jgi:hypothetical protein
MDLGVAFWIAIFLVILLSMFAGDSKGKSAKSERDQADSPRRIIIETLDSKGQVVRRESAHISSGPSAGAQGAPRSRMSDDAARRADLAQFDHMKTS